MGIFADLRRNLSLDPYPDITKLQAWLGKSGPTGMFLQINTTDLQAGTPQFIPSPYNGNITKLAAIVQADVTTGGAITVEVDGIAVAGLSVDVAVDEAMAAFQQDDGGVFTDDTTDMNDAGANDVALYPATAAVDDACCFGAAEPFDTLVLDMGTQGAGTYTVAWEYWDGSAWVSLSVTDGTSAFKAGTATYEVTFTPPTDWEAMVLGVIGSALYYIRAQVDAGSMTTDPLATQGWTARKSAGQSIEVDTPVNDGTEKVLPTSSIEIIPGAAFASAGAVNCWLEIEPS